MSENRIQPKLLTGLIVIIVGALLLFRNLDFLDFTIPNFIFSWQTILIIIGSILIISAKNKSAGLVLITVGVLCLIPEYWPIALILLGLFIIFRKSGFRLGKNDSDPNLGGDSKNKSINEVSIFGGGDRYFNIENFIGGNITAIFGGSKIDLMDCTLAEGKNAIDLFFVFGGSTFQIPNNWRVEIQTISIFGGFSDKRVLPAERNFDEENVLIFKGLILFGGGEIKSYK